MSEKLQRMYAVPEECPEELQLMAIWAQAADDYNGKLSKAQMLAAATWLYGHIANSEGDSPNDDPVCIECGNVLWSGQCKNCIPY